MSLRSILSVWQAPAGMSLAGGASLWLIDLMVPVGGFGAASTICGHAPGAAVHCQSCFVAIGLALAGLALAASGVAEKRTAPSRAR